MIENRENILIAKSLSGELSEEEQREFNQLLENNFTLKCEYDLLKKAWGTSNNQVVFKEKQSKTINWRFVGGIAASFLVLVMTTLLINKNDKEQEQLITYQTGIGETKEIILEDNSKVILNAMSKLSVPEKFKETSREIYLEGEAFFEVTKNKHQPFRVATATVNVEVLGTVFNVRSYPESTNDQVYLSSGKVALTNEAYQHEMSPNQLYNFNKNQKSNLIKIQPKGYEIDWLSGDINFNSSPITEVIKRIKRNYNIQVDIKGVTSEDIITASFNKKQSAEEILQLIGIITDKNLIKLSNNRYQLK